MSTGIITTAILLIVGYVIITKVVGLAFRLAIPLIILVVLAGTGVFSGLMPDHAPDRAAPYGQAQHRPLDEGGSLGDLRIRDMATLAVDAVRSFLYGGLAIIDRITDREWPNREQAVDDGRSAPRARPTENRPDYYEDPPQDWPSRSGRTY